MLRHRPSRVSVQERTFDTTPGLVTGADPATLLQDPDNAFARAICRRHTGTPLDPNRIKSRTIVDSPSARTCRSIAFPSEPASRSG